ncbi:MAG: hypothetical protein U9R39_08360 [Campylobacterota bacterium]|nr:hypothetical protein [Campylobacterota bacterium]
MNKLTKILAATILSVSVANASDVMQKSMTIMQDGIEKVQYGFINNNASMIKEGLTKIEKGNSLFSEEAVIKKYLPSDKKHMSNIAVNSAKRIAADATIIGLNLEDKAYTKAAEGYADMMNACSRCHGLVRSW